jgi:hypothetical protein
VGYPELDRDESIILETRNVKYKSISFDAILTNKRIILSDSKKNVIPSQHIALSTIRNVESGENAIRDHFLILAITTDAGERQQAVLTFVRSAGGERKRECKEWEKKLKNLITASSPETPAPAAPVAEDVLRAAKREVVQESTQTAAATTRPAKKKIEIVRPLGTIIEKSPVAPVPVETSSLPTGTFCSRCGSRVPFKSPFCNHCGTPIINVPAQAQQPPVSGEQVPVPPLPPQPSIPKAPITPPEVPRVQVPAPKALGSTGETPGSPIDQIIHSIEPLIEDSVPRSQQAPLFKKQAPEPAPKPVVTEVAAESLPQVVWPVLPNSESPVVPSVPPASEEPVFPPPPPPPPPAPVAPPVPVLPGKKPNYLGIGILILAILPIIAGLVIVANIMTEPTGVPVVTPTVTATVTKIPTTVPQVTRTPGSTATPALTPTQVMVPPNGVWVRASYPGTYIGLIGTAGNQAEVTGTWDKFYPISTTDGIVAAALQKKDGSGDKIVLEIYKNGVMVKRESTTTPKGIVEIQLDLKTLPGESSPNP